MRPRTKQEIVRGYTQLKAEQARRRVLPFKIAAAVLVLGAGANLYWRHRADISNAVASARAAGARWLEDITDPRHFDPKPDPGQPAQPSTQAVPAKPALEAAPPPAPKPPPAKNIWRVAGTVYDLATLRPVPGAAVVFTRNGRTPQVTTTDRDGRYETDLPKNNGWSVSVTAANRRDGQIVDIDPPYRTRDADARRAAIEHLSDDDLLPSPVGWGRKRSLVTLDLVVVPHHWTGEPQP